MLVIICSCNSNCLCDLTKKQIEKNEECRLMQFLMGLSDSNDVIRSQIVVMEPLPNTGMAYSMLLRVEK